jgi:hypothetical protein
MLLSDKIDKNVIIGGACGARGREEMCIKCFGGKTWLKEATLMTVQRWEDNINLLPVNVENMVS